MNVQVEFYGIPRERAGVASATVAATRLGDALRQLVAEFPKLDGCCIRGERLCHGHVANLNGDCFLDDPDTELSGGDQLLILSGDIGG
jgi:molybdopterin converting factor small subunit